MKIVACKDRKIKEIAIPVDMTEEGLKSAKRVLARLNMELDVNPTAQGISGNQVGESIRVMVCVFHKKRLNIVNPEVLWTYGHKQSNEGCLSVKGRYLVTRPLIGKVKYYDTEGQVSTKILLYKKLRIFMHEFDHLEGKCISDGNSLWKHSTLYYELKKKHNKQ